MSYCEYGQRITKIGHCAFCYNALRQRAEKAEARVAELEKANSVRDGLLEMISEELRTVAWRLAAHINTTLDALND